jgi:cytochrome c-type biogenesis protein CcmI
VTLFWLAVLWLTASTFMFVFLPAGARRQSGSDNDITGANVNVYRDQLTELESELRARRITPEQFQHDREEVEQRLAVDLRTASSPGMEGGHVASRMVTMYWLGMMLSVGAVLLYLAIGSPSSLP